MQKDNGIASEDVNQTNIRFYYAFENLSIESMDKIWKHDENDKNDHIINKKIDDKEIQIKQLNEKYENDIQSLKEEMENKFQQIISKKRYNKNIITM